VLLTIVLVVVSLGISACQPVKAGSAAIVGSSSLSETDVNAQAQEVLAAVTKGGASAATLDLAQVNQHIVGNWVQGELIARIATRLNISVSQGDVDRFLANLVTKSGQTRSQIEASAAAQGGIAPSQLDAVATTLLLGQQIEKQLLPSGTSTEQGAALVKELDSEATRAGLEINPRYGAWDAAHGTVGAAPDLSATVPPSVSPTGSPTPSPTSSGSPSP
jgi:hypothetical protein